MKAKHDNQEKESSVSSIKSDLKFDVLTESFNQAKGSLLTDECYPESIRMKVGTYAAPSENVYSLYKDVSPLYHEFMKSGNMENFYANFYCSIIQNSNSYFSSLEQPLSNLLAKRLCDKLIASRSKRVQHDDTTQIEISSRELDELQYLSGYIISKLLKKSKNSKHYKNEEHQFNITVLTSMKAKKCVEQKLILSQSRGGLLAVIDEVQNIFKIVEKKFRIETSKQHVRKINTRKMVDELLRNSEIISMYGSLTEPISLDINEEIKENLLASLIRLYLRVRAFSLARDITSKHRLALKAKKANALRKNIKKATETPPVPM